MNNDWQILESMLRSLRNASAAEFEFIKEITNNLNWQLLMDKASKLIDNGINQGLFCTISREKHSKVGSKGFMCLDAKQSAELVAPCMEGNRAELKTIKFDNYNYIYFCLDFYNPIICNRRFEVHICKISGLALPACF